MREIKFRVWDGQRMITETIRDNYDDFYTLDLDGTFYPHTRTGDEYFEFEKDELNKKSYVLMQFTGLRDKNGVEIYDCDLLRVKGKMGNQEEYSYDVIYRVILSTCSGLELLFVGLYSQHPDSAQNSYPIQQTPSFKSGGLSVDYRNDKYESLAMCDHYYDDSSGKRHQDHHYTNDIEKIGDIYQNPELLKT